MQTENSIRLMRAKKKQQHSSDLASILFKSLVLHLKQKKNIESPQKPLLCVQGNNFADNNFSHGIYEGYSEKRKNLFMKN